MNEVEMRTTNWYYCYGKVRFICYKTKDEERKWGWTRSAPIYIY